MASPTSQEYSVNWKNHMSHVRKAFDNLLSSNELTDVTLHCEGKKIGAHKMLLSACSGYFRDTFKDVSCQNPIIFMYGVEFGVLSDILRFIYNGEVSVDTSKLDRFLKTAQALQISGLADCEAEKIAAVSESIAQSTSVERNVEDQVHESSTSATSGGDEARKGIKRSKDRETDIANKMMRQENDQVFLPEVKSEPCEMVNFEDLLEDPLMQADQSNDSKDFFGAPGQSLEDEEFKPEEDLDMCEEILEKDEEAELSLIPQKSQDTYKKEFDKFSQWMRNNNAEVATEQVLLEYFLVQSKNYKSSSLWCMYSKLKCMLRIKQDVDISKFSKLTAFLKNCAVGYSPEQSPVFSKDQLIHFFLNAPDDKYLLMKVVAIFGLFGACRRVEFYNLCIGDVKEEGSVFVVYVRGVKAPRTFTILNDDSRVNYTDLIKKYMSLRPKYVKLEKFFLFYNAGKCTCNPIGINTFGQIPRNIAKYLKIPNADQYTGHSFRRTSATILADSGADFRTVKRH